MLFGKKKKKKKKKGEKEKKIVYRKSHIYNNISRAGKYKYKLWRTLLAMNFASVHLWIQSFDDTDKILVIATTALTTNEINRNLLNEAAFTWCIGLFYRWYITLKIATSEKESSIDIALIDYLNWPQKNKLVSRLNADNTKLPSRIHLCLTDELSSPMINDISGIVIILVDHFNKFSFLSCFTWISWP